MEFLKSMGSILTTVIVTLVLSLIANEGWVYAPVFSRWLIRRASRKLAQAERIASEAEWLAHLDDVNGNLTKVIHALGIWSSSISFKPREIKYLNLDLVLAGSFLMVIPAIGSGYADIKDLNFRDVASYVQVVLDILQLPPVLVVIVVGLRERKKGRYMRMSKAPSDKE